MRKPLMRIPYTDAFAAPTVLPATASTLTGAVKALSAFFAAPAPDELPSSTVVLSGAGLSVASGLPDYRGPQGTYRVNRLYRPIYYHEFLSSHEARKRYWARSFLGWPSLQDASPNVGHYAIRDLANLGVIRSVITQNVDSFHPKAHPGTPTVELHGYLRSTVCTSCHSEFSRQEFQHQLARLNPRWAAFLAEAIESGALGADEGGKRGPRGIKTNPDGDVDLPDAPYTTFRYPPCPKCLSRPPIKPDGHKHVVKADPEGAWVPASTAGVLKPAVTMFGENLSSSVRTAAEEAIDGAGRLLIVGTSLATYSAWRLAKRATDRGMPIAMINLGGVRREDEIFKGLSAGQAGEEGVRVELPIGEVLPALVSHLRQDAHHSVGMSARESVERNSGAFKDMLS